MPVPRVTRIAVAAAMAIVATAIGIGTAQAASGTWGPNGLVYRNGVLCDDGSETAALVSWTAAATNRPAFGLYSITAGDGGSGTAAVPAVDTLTSAPLDPATSGLSDAQSAALAYLLATAGTSSDPATVGDVAAIVANDVVSTSCLQSGTQGLDASTAAGLTRRAARLAGPYTVDVATTPKKLVPGASVTARATVRSAAGVRVPDLSVRFASSDRNVTISGAGITDARGTASAQVDVPAASATGDVPLSATVRAPVDLIQMTEPGAVPLVAAGANTTFTGTTDLTVDTTADPELTLRPGSALVLPGSGLTAQAAVTGLRGHSGIVRLSALGPLPFSSSDGCAAHTAPDYATSASSQLRDAVRVHGDGTVALSGRAASTAGCYLLIARIDTTNAIPNVSATSPRTDLSAVLGVAPLHLAITPTDHGVAGIGPLGASVTVSGKAPAQLQDVSGSIFGPRPAVSGTCPDTGWGAARAAGALSQTDAGTAGHVALTSDPVSRGDCYAFRVAATLTLPGIGTIHYDPGAPSVAAATVLVLDPGLGVTSLSAPSVVTGGHIRASVTVNETLGQAAHLQLHLAHLPYTTQGCFGRDWTAATVQPLPAGAPVTRTSGDNTYLVTSPPVHGLGCWTVEPTLTVDANPAITVTYPPPSASMVAFTSVQRPFTATRDTSAAHVGGATRPLVAGILAAVLLCWAVGFAVHLGRRPMLDFPR